jgi:zinc transporter
MVVFDELQRGPLWAYRFEKGAASAIAGAPALMEPTETGWVWAHFALSDRRSCEQVQRFEGAPQEVRDLLLGPDQSPQFGIRSGWTFGVLPDFEREFDGRPGDPGRLRFAFDATRLITTRRHPLLTVDDLHRRFTGGGRLDTPLAAILAFIGRYLELAEDQLDVIAEALDDLEDQALSEISELERLNVGPMRRDLARRHREITALRTAFHRTITRQDSAQPLIAHLPALIQRAEDVDREVVTLQERGKLIYEEIDSKITGATNRTLRALTIISTLLMPPTLIVGAFGMNLKGITFGDDPAGFFWACGLCVAAVVAAFVALLRYGVVKIGR